MPSALKKCGSNTYCGLKNNGAQPDATAQRPQLSRVVLAHAPRQLGSWLTWDVRIFPQVRHYPHELAVAGRKDEDESDGAFPGVKNYRMLRQRS